MKTNEFYTVGPVLGVTDGYVKVTVDGIGDDGTVYFVDPDGNEYNFTVDEVDNLRNQNKMIGVDSVADVPSDLAAVLDTLGTARDNTTNPWSDQRLSEAQVNVFKAVVEENR